MAGLVVVGGLLVGGIVGGTVLQSSLRAFSVTFPVRAVIQLACVGTGAILMRLFMDKGSMWTNLGVWFTGGALVGAGIVAMTEGLLVDLWQLCRAQPIYAIPVALVFVAAGFVFRRWWRRPRTAAEQHRRDQLTEGIVSCH